MALSLDLQPGESVTIGDARITVEEKSGRRTRLRIEAPGDVTHHKTGQPALTAPNKTQTPVTAPTLRRPTSQRST